MKGLATSYLKVTEYALDVNNWEEGYPPWDAEAAMSYRGDVIERINLADKGTKAIIKKRMR